jgi:hypothetical protein
LPASTPGTLVRCRPGKPDYRVRPIETNRHRVSQVPMMSPTRGRRRSLRSP